MASYEYSIDGGTNWLNLPANNVTRVRKQASVDELRFNYQASQALTDSPFISYGTAVQVRRDATLIFSGKVSSIPREGAGNSESQQIVISGPWNDLQKVAYQQSWKSYNTSTQTEETITKTRVILGLSATGTRWSATQQISDAVSWAISRGVDLQIGTISTTAQLPLDERDNVTCADVIQAMLRWLPTLNVWIDYSTSPPTFNCVSRASLSSVSKALTDGSNIGIRARYDLQVPGVSITYEKTHSEGNNTWVTTEEDTAGNTGALETVFMTFDLEGSRRTYMSARIEVDEFPVPLINKAFLKKMYPALSELPDEKLFINSVSRDGVENYPRFLVKGMIPDWLTSVNTEDETLTWDISYDLGEGFDIFDSVENQKIQVPVVATDGLTSSYKRTASFDSGENTPTGVATAIYNSWSVLHFEGQFTYEQDECDLIISPGSLFNLSSGRTEWATMDAAVQTLTEQFDEGRTIVQFGPPKRIEADSLVALFRALRTRRFAWSSNQKTSSENDSDGQVEIGGSLPGINTTFIDGQRDQFVVKGNDGTDDHKVDLNPKEITHAESADQGARHLKSREVLLPFLDAGTIKFQKVQILASDLYGTVTTLPDIPDELKDLLSGTANGQIPWWDHANSEWKLSDAPAGANAIPYWDGSKITWTSASSTGGDFPAIQSGGDLDYENTENCS